MCVPRWALRPAELVLLSLIALAGWSPGLPVFAGHDMLRNLFGAVGHARGASQVETGWRERFLSISPNRCFSVGDMDALRARTTMGSLPYRWEWLRGVGVAPDAVGGVHPYAGGDVSVPELSGAGSVDARGAARGLRWCSCRWRWWTPSGAFWHSKAMWAGFATARSPSAGWNGVHVGGSTLPDLPWIKRHDD